MNMNEESPENQLKEIDLLDFIRVVKKRKKMVFGLFLLGLVSGIIWFFLSPSSYRGIIIFKIGELENIKEIAEGLKRGIYSNYPKLEVAYSSGTNLIEIDIATKDRAKTNAFLEKIKTDILSIHNKKGDDKIKTINQEISFLGNKIDEFKKDISYFSARGDQTAILKLEIYKIEKQIHDLEAEKLNIPMTDVVKGPEIEEKRPGYLSIFFATILGLFVGLISASFLEWIGKNKKRI